MPFEFISLRDLSPNVVAALFGAAVTLTAALINLRIAWRREALARQQGSRPNKARRGLLPAIAFMVVASAVGGYALALYLMQMREGENALLRTELRQRAEQIQSSAERIASARVHERQTTLAEARLEEERRRGAEGVQAGVRIAPCKASGGSACREEDAPRTAVCAPLPARAVAVEVVALAGMAASADGGAVAYAPVALGAEVVGSARIASRPVERGGDGSGRMLCLDAWSWDAQRWLDLRIVVKYLLNDPAAAPAPGGASAPVTTAHATPRAS